MMDIKSKDKYEQIRSIASRDWLKPASVSLAKLDEVKAKVYNLGLADPKQLKATSENLVVRQADNNAEPPLSSLVQQRHVWGSNNSIPDLLKQQNEKEKITRPWSAQNSTVQMKVTLKKSRPHSAKDLTNKPPRPGSAKKPMKASIAVKGAHYEAGERPPGGVGACHTVSGWAAPLGGIHSEHAIDMVTQKQNFIRDKDLGSAIPVDMPPPPPRGSPDFNHFLDTNESNQRINSAVGHLVDDLLDDTRKPSPREPIRLTLPSAEQEEETNSDKEDFNDVIDDIDDWIEEKKKYNAEEFDVDKVLSGFDEKLEIGSISSKLLRTDIGTSAEELCNDFASSNSSSENEADMPNNEVGKKKKDVHVTFDEHQNKTRTITPRDDNYETVVPAPGIERNTTKSTEKAENEVIHHRATPNLRNINSRINSGFRPRTSSRRIDRKPKSYSSPYATNTDKYQSPGRTSPSKQQVPISTIAVTYLEDEDYLNNTRAGSARRRNKGQNEIETVISQLSLSDTDSEEEKESRPESRTKTVSKYSNKNYYQQVLSENKPKVLTRKTLELGDGSVIERKSVLMLDSHKQAHKTYVVPKENRPKSVPTDNRPKSSIKPRPYSTPNKPEKEVQPVSTLIEPTTQLTLQDQRSAGGKNSTNDSQTEAVSGVSEPVEKHKPRKEVTFADNPEVGAHDCKCVTPAAVHARRPQSAVYKAPYRKLGSNRDTKSQEERVKFPKPVSLVKKRIDDEKRKQVLDNTPQITTKYRDYEVEDSEGVKECREMQEHLLDAGVPVTLETLYRALLPPTQYPVPQVSVVTNTAKPLPRHTAGLVSKPCYWLPEEHKKLVQANKFVRQANVSLWYQEREEEREALRAAGITITKKKKKRRSIKKSIAGYQPNNTRIQSAPSGEQIHMTRKRNKSAPPGGRRKREEVKDKDSTADQISLQDLV